MSTYSISRNISEIDVGKSYYPAMPGVSQRLRRYLVTSSVLAGLTLSAGLRDASASIVSQTAPSRTTAPNDTLCASETRNAPTRSTAPSVGTTSRTPAPTIESILPPGFSAWPDGSQGAWLTTQLRSGALSNTSDAQLCDIMMAIHPGALVAYLRAGIAPLTSYQFNMSRWEARNGKWPRQPDRMYVRYQDVPRRVYVKWLPGGAHAGQEILYNESEDPRHLTGHFGGLFTFASMSFPIDGAIAHSQSSHSVREIGLQFTVTVLEQELSRYRAEQLAGNPSDIDIVHASDNRYVDLTWTAPAGASDHYAARVKLSLDLHHPWPSAIEAWDTDGAEREKTRFDNVVPEQWDDETFQKKNPAYNFR